MHSLENRSVGLLRKSHVYQICFSIYELWQAELTFIPFSRYPK